MDDLTTDTPETTAAATPPETSTEAPAQPEPGSWEAKKAQLRELASVVPSSGDDEEEEAADAGASTESDISDDNPDTETPTADAGAGHEPVVLRLPGRNPTDEEFVAELPAEAIEALENAGVDVQALVERVNQARNGFNRTEALRAREDQIQRDRQDLELVESEMRDDPGGFLVERVRPELRRDVATVLLAHMDQDDFDATIDTLAQWQRDPRLRETHATKLENQRLKQSVTRTSESRVQEATNTEARKLVDAISGLIPESWDPGRGQRFFSLAVDTLAQYAEAQNIERLDPGEVSAILADAGVLGDYGLDPSSRPSTTETGAPPKAEPGSAAAKKDPKERVARRKDAAAAAPAGVGAGASAGLKPPKGQSSEERFKWLRERFGGRASN